MSNRLTVPGYRKFAFHLKPRGFSLQRLCLPVYSRLSSRFRVNDSDRARLVAENQMLKIENKNLTFKIRRLDDQVGRMEEGSQRVVTLMQTE